MNSNAFIGHLFSILIFPITKPITALSILLELDHTELPLQSFDSFAKEDVFPNILNITKYIKNNNEESASHNNKSSKKSKTKSSKHKSKKAKSKSKQAKSKSKKAKPKSKTKNKNNKSNNGNGNKRSFSTYKKNNNKVNKPPARKRRKTGTKKHIPIDFQSGSDSSTDPDDIYVP